jgi:Mn2+/Fe2+ NRAMP family transporter
MRCAIVRAMFKRSPSFLRHVGPGVVTGAADDDPSGIATYTQAGAQYGTGLVWTVFLSLPFMIAIQLVSARIGRVSGKGVAANLRDHTPRWFLMLVASKKQVMGTFVSGPKTRYLGWAGTALMAAAVLMMGLDLLR